ncbi:peptidase inhibitor family I36 protein [Streptomyces colonosanans]|uniref:Peptidase inhibitor n=1 Tax=Streptomyces colonosanans TaxID=1428652 RepID=A0A1S2PGC9_9ACTN|nr:peptidase inhibitor family I36 protein [Streptomyces colonosanans]OIJ92666.1 peptidase inhibitor [Streptomyces colonosanans]
MRRIRSFALASVALVAALGAVPAAAATPTTTAHRTDFDNCAPGHFCIYSAYKGKGTRCQWQQPSKANTADDCSFIRRGQKVLSVWNGTGHRVQYYTQTNYHNRVGSTRAGAGGNLMGSYQIRSFKPQ